MNNCISFLKWVKKNFIQRGELWQKMYNPHPKAFYTDKELYDYYMDYVRNN